jgi:hypothetical protein
MENQRDERKSTDDVRQLLREVKEGIEAIPAICDKWLKDDRLISRSTTS